MHIIMSELSNKGNDRQPIFHVQRAGPLNVACTHRAVNKSGPLFLHAPTARLLSGLVRHQGVLEHGLHILKESGLLVPDFVFDKKTTSGAGLFAISISQGTGVDETKGQLVNSLAGETRRQAFFQQLKDILGRGERHGSAPE